jgi:hypothetical protein
MALLPSTSTKSLVNNANGTVVFYQPDAVVNRTQLSISGTGGVFNATVNSATVSRPIEITQTDVLNTYNNVYTNGKLTSSSASSTSNYKVLFSTVGLVNLANKGNSGVVDGVLSRMPISSVMNNQLNINAGYYNNQTNTVNKTNNTYNNVINRTVYGGGWGYNNGYMSMGGWVSYGRSYF